MLAAFLLEQSYEDINYSGYDDIDCTNYSVFFSIFRWQESIAGVSLDDICDIRERNCAARMLDINFVEEIAWLKYDFFLL